MYERMLRCFSFSFALGGSMIAVAALDDSNVAVRA